MSLAAFILAVVPAVVLMVMIYKKDKIEPEPIGLLIKLFFFGVLTILPALALESLGELIEGVIFEEGSIPLLLFDNFLVVAVAEELVKFYAFRFGAWKHKDFDYTFDAIVYMGCVAIGFAIPENILYVLDGGVSLAIIRAVTSIPGHICFGMFMGYYLGRAKACEAAGDIAGRKKNLRLSLIVPVLLHGFFDFTLSTQSLLMLVCYFIFIVILDVFAVKLVLKASREDRRIWPEEELFEAGGMISEGDNGEGQA
ncbi:MAG: PrsW family intramembrane metalloprotease [Lachnospiraceae bacterium]|nr:PrsW family intramembrane metalloprotease [Lachnospiraceae bacterium]